MSALNYNWYEVMGDMQQVQVASQIATQLCKVSIKSFGQCSLVAESKLTFTTLIQYLKCLFTIVFFVFDVLNAKYLAFRTSDTSTLILG